MATTSPTVETVTITVTRDELCNIVNDYEARLSLYEYEDEFNMGGCDAAHDVNAFDHILLAMVDEDCPYTCPERTREARATVQRLRAILGGFANR